MRLFCESHLTLEELREVLDKMIYEKAKIELKQDSNASDDVERADRASREDLGETSDPSAKADRILKKPMF